MFNKKRDKIDKHAFILSGHKYDRKYSNFPRIKKKQVLFFYKLISTIERLIRQFFHEISIWTRHKFASFPYHDYWKPTRVKGTIFRDARRSTLPVPLVPWMENFRDDRIACSRDHDASLTMRSQPLAAPGAVKFRWDRERRNASRVRRTFETSSNRRRSRVGRDEIHVKSREPARRKNQDGQAWPREGGIRVGARSDRRCRTRYAVNARVFRLTSITMRPTGLSSAVMSKKTRGSAISLAAAAKLRRSVSKDGRLGRAVAPKWLDRLKVESIDSRQIDLNAIFYAPGNPPEIDPRARDPLPYLRDVGFTEFFRPFRRLFGENIM